MTKKSAKRHARLTRLGPVSAKLFPAIHMAENVEISQSSLIRFLTAKSKSDCVFEFESKEFLTEGSTGILTLKAKSTLYGKNTTHKITLPCIRFVKSQMIWVFMRPLSITNDPDFEIEERFEDVADSLSEIIQGETRHLSTRKELT